MGDQTDTELVIAVQNGDIPAFETLVNRYQYGLHVFAVRYVKDWDAAADIVQETFISVYDAIDTVDTARKFSTFLFGIAKNKSISYLRTRKKLVAMDAIEEISQDGSFIENFLRDDMIARVRDAVSGLPDNYRNAISLFYFEKLTYDEIAKKLRVPVNTVRTHIRRGKDMLKKVLPYETD